MEKRTYKTPIADRMDFDYKDTVTASDPNSNWNPGHCTYGKNPGHSCDAPLNYGQCKDDYNRNPAHCDNNW